MPGLTPEQLTEFLTTGRPIMKLATIGPEGWPYVCPVWFDYDGETFTVAGRRPAKWVANIRANSKVSACIDTYDAPYTRVIMEADAVIEDDAWLRFAPSTAIRYLGEEEGVRYFNSTKDEPRCFIRITPRTVSSWTGGGWHPKYRVSDSGPGNTLET